MSGRAYTFLVLDESEDDIAMLRGCLANLTGIDCQLSVEMDRANAVTRIQALDPAVVFLDCRLGETAGLQVLCDMREQGLLHPVIVLAGQADVYVAVAMIRAGANDYLLKSDLGTGRLKAILQRVMDEAEQDKDIRAERSETLSRLRKLTPRESEVLDELVNGLTNRQIAAKMHRSVETIKVHRAHIMSKLMADSTADLVRRVVYARMGD